MNTTESTYVPTVEHARTMYRVGVVESHHITREEAGAEFDKFIARVKAEAWDEGYWEGQSDAPYGLVTNNPYKP